MSPTSSRCFDAAVVDEPPAVLGRGQTIRSGFSAELDEHQRRAREAREWIAGLERTERERTGIRSLKVGYNKVFGYYIEITTAALATAERERGDVLPADYIPKQSLTNATRYFTPQLKEYETVVLNAEDTLSQLEGDDLSPGRRPGRCRGRPVAGRSRSDRLPRRRRDPCRGRRPAQLRRAGADRTTTSSRSRPDGIRPSKQSSRAASTCRTTPA